MFQQSLDGLSDVFTHSWVQPRGTVVVCIQDKGIATLLTNLVQYLIQLLLQRCHGFTFGLAKQFLALLLEGNVLVQYLLKFALALLENGLRV